MDAPKCLNVSWKHLALHARALKVAALCSFVQAVYRSRKALHTECSRHDAAPSPSRWWAPRTRARACGGWCARWCAACAAARSRRPQRRASAAPTSFAPRRERTSPLSSPATRSLWRPTTPRHGLAHICVWSLDSCAPDGRRHRQALQRRAAGAQQRWAPNNPKARESPL